MVRAVALERQQDDRRNDGVGDERLCRTEASRVHGLVSDPEPLAVHMKVVPHHPEVEVEDVPADPPSDLRANRRCVTDEASPVDAQQLHGSRRGLSHSVRFGALMRPGDDASWPHGHVVGVVPSRAVLDRYAGGGGSSRGDAHDALHRVEAAEVLERALVGEGVREGSARRERAAVEPGVGVFGAMSVRSARETMEEERHLEVGLARKWIANDQATEQPKVHVVVDVEVVIVERPRADRLLRHVECVAPLVARADRVATPSVSVRNPKRPRAIGIDAVDEAVNVEAVREVVRV